MFYTSIFLTFDRVEMYRNMFYTLIFLEKKSLPTGKLFYLFNTPVYGRDRRTAWSAGHFWIKVKTLILFEQNWWKIRVQPIRRGIWSQVFLGVLQRGPIFGDRTIARGWGGENGQLVLPGKVSQNLSVRLDQKQKFAKKWTWVKHFH